MASFGSDFNSTRLSASFWVAHAIIYSILCCFNVWVLIRELVQIHKGKAKYTTKYLKLWALLSIISGAFSQIFRAIRHFPIVCTFVYYAANMLSGWQAVFMGFYQLSRLYYCFSTDKVYLKYGYPQTLFRIMFTIGFILLINYILFPIIDDNLFSQCEVKLVDDTYYFYRHPLIIFGTFETRTLWKNMTGMIYFIWDVVTLCLYIHKIQILKKSEQKQDKIQSVMNRIFILTLFYQIPVILIMLFSIISLSLGWPLYDWSFVGATTSFLFSFSVSLMIEHNTLRYIKVLKIIKKMKLHILFFCCYTCTKREIIYHENNANINEVGTTANGLESTDDLSRSY